MKNWFSHILFHTDARPEAAAMVMEDRVVTYGMLKLGMKRCARRISALGLNRGDTVAVLVQNPIRHLTLSLALFRIGLRCISLEHGQSGMQQLKFVVVLTSEVGAMRADLSPLYEIEHILRLEWDLADAAAVLVEGASADGEPQLWIGIVDNKGATAEKLAAVLRRRGLSYDIKLFDVQTIPRGANGKVNRQNLEALLRDAGHRSNGA